jgi:hypothetical protein
MDFGRRWKLNKIHLTEILCGSQSSLTFSQETANAPNSQSDESRPQPPTLPQIRFIIIIFINITLPMRDTCTNHLIFFTLITLIKFVEERML